MTHKKGTMMEYTIDVNRLRRDLMDYFGTAMFSASPLAVMDLSRVERASDLDVVKMAQENGMDLREYIVCDD